MSPATQPVDVLATEPHFLDHLAPIWHALSSRGRRGIKRGRVWVAPSLTRQAQRLDLDAAPWAGDVEDLAQLVAVASYGDLRRATGTRQDPDAAPRRRAIYAEHGCGLTYDRGELGPHTSYAGHPHRPGVELYLCPNDRVAQLNAAAHPETPTAVVGSPRVDELAAIERLTPSMAGEDRPVVAVSFHWDCHVVPETRSTAGRYSPALAGLAKRYTVLGHAHPRIWDRMRYVYGELGIERVRRFDEVIRRADLYVVDNSSTLYEWVAATDRPVVVLNAPFYRRDVEHGLRFWDLIPGAQVDHPAQLTNVVAEALDDPPELAQLRRQAVEAVYPHRGDAAKRAAAAIEEVLGR